MCDDDEESNRETEQPECDVPNYSKTVDPIKAVLPRL